MNAIVLAAGLGSRFGTWTKKKHKSLLPIQGIPNLERTVLFLIASDISPIYIITGHMSGDFEYLKNRYPQVQLVHNPYYKKYNSIYSFSMALSYFSNSWVIDADTVIAENIFRVKPKRSTYFTILRNSDSIEWCPVTRNHRVEDIIITDAKLPSISGISYWNETDCFTLKHYYQKYMTEEYLTDPKLYWDHIVKYNMDKLDVTSVRVSSNALFEMDTKEDYFTITKHFASLPLP